MEKRRVEWWCNGGWMHYNHTQTQREKTQNKPTPRWFKISPVLTSLPSVSKTSKSRVMRYCVGATSCQMQFLLGGYSLGHPGLVMDPFSLVMKPPQAAGQRGQRHRWRYPIICANVPKMFWVEQSLRCKHVVLEIEKNKTKEKAMEASSVSWINLFTERPACGDLGRFVSVTQYATCYNNWCYPVPQLLIFRYSSVLRRSLPTTIDAVLIHWYWSY